MMNITDLTVTTMNNKVLLETISFAVHTHEIRKLNFDNIELVLRSYPAELSGGMLQRLTIANLFALEPKVILADEPTSALDDKNKRILLQHLLELKKNAAIILVNHDAKAIREIGDSVIFLMNGKIVLDGKVSELQEHPPSIRSGFIILLMKWNVTVRMTGNGSICCDQRKQTFL